MSAIEIFCRVRPTRKTSRWMTLDHETARVEYNIPRDAVAGLINNQKEDYSFKFSHLLDQDVTQQQVFDTIGRPVAESALQGYNGTIFAYGQTGSGKTFTITGGADSYEDRGLIPRTLAFLFEHIKSVTSSIAYEVSISYMEIYNDAGYDLLDPDHDTKNLEDLPKVSIVTDNDGNYHTKNLSQQSVATMEDALNLLFIGDTNRVICETPMNDQSSRSHCIFTVNLTGRQVGGSTIRRSKLHLVDLAGSERPKKSNINGKIFTEAKAINLSLHFLEQVIVALYEKSQGKRAHVPYRNSMMTTVLRDSLGGNCKTAMVATLSAEKSNLDESISTCRFAQRVSRIKNECYVNVEQDPKLVIAQLRREISVLREELALASGGAVVERPLSDDERQQCRRLCLDYVNDTAIVDTGGKDGESGNGGGKDGGGDVDADTVAAHRELFTSVMTNAGKSRAVLATLRSLVLEQARAAAANQGNSTNSHHNSNGNSSSHNNSNSSSVVVGAGTTDAATATELRSLRAAVAARDHEISVLVGMLQGKKEGDTGYDVVDMAAAASSQSQTPAEAQQRQQQRTQQELQNMAGGDAALVEQSQQLLEQRAVEFEAFARDYRRAHDVDKHKAELRAKFDAAKQLGTAVNTSRSKINGYKRVIEQRRVARGMRGLNDGDGGGGDGDGGNNDADAEERQLTALIEEEKQAYRRNFKLLKQHKQEIEHGTALLERSRRRLQHDFERHWQERQRGLRPSAAASSKSAASSQQPSRASSRMQDPSTYAAQQQQQQQQQPQEQPLTLDRDRRDRHIDRVSHRHDNNHNTAAAGSGGGGGGGSSGSGSSVAAIMSSAAAISSTGNAQADNDIAAFYRMRDEMLAAAKAAAAANGDSGGSDAI